MTIQEAVKQIEALRISIDSWSVINDAIEMLACSIASLDSTTDRCVEMEALQTRYSSSREKMTRVCAILSELCMQNADGDHEICDVLGELYMQSGKSSKMAGQFFTPFHVSRLTAELGMESAKPDEYGVITLNEPSCGSGGMILACAEWMRRRGINYAERLFAVGQDVDGRCVRMAYVQCSLAGIPAIIKHGDTLRMETHDIWITPAALFNWVKFRRYARGSDAL